MRRGTSAVAIGAAAICALAAPAQAITVTETRGDVRDFAGEGCGSTASSTLYLPHGARLTGTVPRAGAALLDQDTDKPIARVRPRQVRVSGKRAVRFVATSSDDACANPAAYADFGWAATDVPLTISYRVQRRVYFRSFVMGSYTSAQYRPRRILFGERSGVEGVRWSRWNGREARGRGTLLFNDCRPDCAEARPRYYRLRITLSRVRRCGERYDYTRFAFRYVGARPPGLGRSYAERHSCRPGATIGPS